MGEKSVHTLDGTYVWYRYGTVGAVHTRLPEFEVVAKIFSLPLSVCIPKFVDERSKSIETESTHIQCLSPKGSHSRADIRIENT